MSKKAFELVNSNKETKIKKFIRNTFTNEPIIPGSTMKGVIRTALANYLFHKKYFHKLRNEKNEREFMTQIFGKIHEDFLKTLIISDLKPINYKLKIIRPFYKIRIDDEPNDLDILECLTEGKFEGEILINKKLRQIKDQVNFNLVETALEDFYKDILDFERSRIKEDKYTFPPYQPYLVKLGLHSGAGSKSIKDKRKIKVILKQSDGKTKTQYLNYQLSTWFAESYDAMGWGKIVIE